MLRRKKSIAISVLTFIGARSLSLLQELAPKGVVIVELLTKDYTVSISGQAGTRDQFLEFESALKGAECVSDVRVPISNLFSQKEIEFQVDFKLKRECLLHL